MTTPESAETQVCPTCAEAIKAAARLCPYCQSPTGRWVLTRQELAPLVTVVVLAGLLIGAGVWLDSKFSGPQGRSFRSHRTQVEVARLSLDNAGGEQRYAVMGFVTNRSAYPWRVREIELRFLNPDGTLLDVRQVALRDVPVVRSSSETAFRVELGRLPALVSAATLAARVHYATDGDRSPDPD
jgi:hypothetical protein